MMPSVVEATSSTLPVASSLSLIEPLGPVSLKIKGIVWNHLGFIGVCNCLTAGIGFGWCCRSAVEYYKDPKRLNKRFEQLSLAFFTAIMFVSFLSLYNCYRVVKLLA